MSCEELSEELSAYLDHELSPEERARLEDHLQTCPRCRQELESLRAVSRLVASLPQVEPSPSFIHSIRAHLVPQRRRWLRPISPFAVDVVPLVAVAALFLVVLSAALIWPFFARSGSKAVGPSDSRTPLRSVEEAPPAPVPAARPESLAGEAEDGGRYVTSYRAGDELKRSGGGDLAEGPARDEVHKEVFTFANGKARQLGADVGDDKAPELVDSLAAEPEFALESAASRRERAVGYDVEEVKEPPAEPGVASDARGVVENKLEVAEAEAGDAAGPLMAKGAPSAVTGPGFHTVVLYCTDANQGRSAWRKAMSEFQLLSTPMPPLVTHTEMSHEYYRRYNSYVRDLFSSPEVVTYREMQVLPSDLELVRAVFSEDATVTYADESTDVNALREFLTQSRQRRSTRAATAPRSRDSSSSVRSGWQEAREAYERQVLDMPDQKLVDVIVVLKLRDQPQPEAPAQTGPPSSKPE